MRAPLNHEADLQLSRLVRTAEQAIDHQVRQVTGQFLQVHIHGTRFRKLRQLPEWQGCSSCIGADIGVTSLSGR